jgi:C-terminal processing protease CtpA/Prc
MLRNLALFLVVVLCLVPNLALGQIGIQKRATPSSPGLNRERGLAILLNIKEAIEERYYDKTYNGIDLDARFKSAAERIRKLDANWQIYRVIAQVVLDFDDSHTIFYPPERLKRVQYGFSLQMIGETCYVVDVKKGSDAESKGLKVGDVVNRIGSFRPDRSNLWKINYLYYSVDPQEVLKLSVLGADNTPKDVEIKAAFRSEEENELEARKRRKAKLDDPYKCRELNTETIACKLRTFAVGTDRIDKLMKEVSGYKKMILDLRGNDGGYVKTEQYLTGFFFDRDVKIGDLVSRGKTSERLAKPQKNGGFKGELVVLIDSDSRSAAEVFARVIQIEKRGQIVGDVSSGMVMTSQFHSLTTVRPGKPDFEFSVFGLNLTIADLIMSDGNRLEKVGVVPDHPLGPTRTGLANGADPVLAFAAGLLKVKITPEEAGKFYFLTTKPEGGDDETTTDDENKS